MKQNLQVSSVSESLTQVRDDFDVLWKVGVVQGANKTVHELILNEINSYKKHHRLRTDYPKGYCLPITNILFAAMNRDEFFEQYPPLSTVQEYIRSGDARVIWGACRGIYFQTAMQIGEWYVDVANDTVDVTKPKVEIHRMDSPECPFKFISDLKTYLSIKESYHDVTIFRNTVFSALTELYPIISLSNSHKYLTLEPDSYIAKLRKMDPDYTSTLKCYPDLPADLVAWIYLQPELEPYTRPAISQNYNPDHKTQKMQLRLMVTAINSFLEKRWS